MLTFGRYCHAIVHTNHAEAECEDKLLHRRLPYCHLPPPAGASVGHKCYFPRFRFQVWLPMCSLYRWQAGLRDEMWCGILHRESGIILRDRPTTNVASILADSCTFI
jgi:hypothetical protein